jgi:hypothetical protein
MGEIDRKKVNRVLLSIFRLSDDEFEYLMSEVRKLYDRMKKHGK